MPMEMSTRVNGATTRQKERELTVMRMVPIMKALGLMINSMGMALSHGQTVLAMKVNTSRAKKRTTAG